MAMATVMVVALWVHFGHEPPSLVVCAMAAGSDKGNDNRHRHDDMTLGHDDMT